MILNLAQIVETAIKPAYEILPPNMASDRATLMLLAIGLQESRFAYRRQLADGPARGFWQFEQGTARSKGGVWGVYLHRASAEQLRVVCRARDVSLDPKAIWAQLEHDDVLAAAVARLLLWTHHAPLPAIGAESEAWSYYLNLWRPGKPHPETWPELYQRALRALRILNGEEKPPATDPKEST